MNARLSLKSGYTLTWSDGSAKPFFTIAHSTLERIREFAVNGQYKWDCLAIYVCRFVPPSIVVSVDAEPDAHDSCRRPSYRE